MTIQIPSSTVLAKVKQGDNKKRPASPELSMEVDDDPPWPDEEDDDELSDSDFHDSGEVDSLPVSTSSFQGASRAPQTHDAGRPSTATAEGEADVARMEVDPPGSLAGTSTYALNEALNYRAVLVHWTRRPAHRIDWSWLMLSTEQPNLSADMEVSVGNMLATLYPTSVNKSQYTPAASTQGLDDMARNQPRLIQTDTSHLLPGEFTSAPPSGQPPAPVDPKEDPFSKRGAHGLNVITRDQPPAIHTETSHLIRPAAVSAALGTARWDPPSDSPTHGFNDIARDQPLISQSHTSHRIPAEFTTAPPSGQISASVFRRENPPPKNMAQGFNDVARDEPLAIQGQTLYRLPVEAASVPPEGQTVQVHRRGDPSNVPYQVATSAAGGKTIPGDRWGDPSNAPYQVPAVHTESRDGYISSGASTRTLTNSDVAVQNQHLQSTDGVRYSTLNIVQTDRDSTVPAHNSNISAGARGLMTRRPPRPLREPRGGVGNRHVPYPHQQSIPSLMIQRPVEMPKPSNDASEWLHNFNRYPSPRPPPAGAVPNIVVTLAEPDIRRSPSRPFEESTEHPSPAPTAHTDCSSCMKQSHYLYYTTPYDMYSISAMTECMPRSIQKLLRIISMNMLQRLRSRIGPGALGALT
ncbi:hypothetical protein B0H16DRAFT_1465191 [Mycena metata]|uniref:Uncharacterized protein n=1 Tax=Mycena metata TaxID=1033252 RepID=A0AAD7IDE8_9AGAR|nr:hypothetical protein B0H16DRAFT_1465191 [Mycena metata]